MKLAFLGLGQMGAPMAANLVDAGHDVIVWNRSIEKAAPLRDKGASVADSPAEAAKGAEIAFTMLSTPEVVEEVVLGPRGAASGLGERAILVEMSTIGPEASQRLRERVPTELVDAPVLGSIPQAEAGALQIFVGAEESVFNRVGPALEPLGEPFLIGGPGSGAAMKLVANSTLGSLITTLAEALRLGEALGLDRLTLLERLGRSPIATTVARKKDLVASGSYPPSFKLELARKDMRLVQEAAAAAGVELKVNRAAETYIVEADEAGLGDLDYSAVIAHVLGAPARP